MMKFKPAIRANKPGYFGRATDFPIKVARRHFAGETVIDDRIEVVLVGHGRSPEGKHFAGRINAASLVVRMWDWEWQTSKDYGQRYDFGVIEISNGDLKRFWQYYKSEPAFGYIASFLHPTVQRIPPSTSIISQYAAGWVDEAKAMGGLGATGRLEFTRGSIAAMWLMESYLLPQDHLVLVGFDMVRAGHTFPTNDAFAPSYQTNPGSFGVHGWRGGVTKYGNHDFAVEAPLLRKVAERNQVRMSFAQDIW